MQATAPPTHPFGAEAFHASQTTTLRWLGMAGFLINSRGTTFMIDPCPATREKINSPSAGPIRRCRHPGEKSRQVGDSVDVVYDPA